MKDDSDNNTSIILVIEPVCKNRSRQDTDKKIHNRDDIGSPQGMLIGMIDKKERDMPQRPDDGKEKSSGEQREFTSQTIHAVASPAQFFEGGGQDNERQHVC